MHTIDPTRCPKKMPKNVFYTVVDRNDSDDNFFRFLQDHKNQAGIVFCQLRKDVIETVQDLQKLGIDAIPYHAGLDAATRQEFLDKFLFAKNAVLVATYYFVKDIGKPDIRFIAHLTLPRSLTDYLEQASLVGRDGVSAEVWLGFDKKEISDRRKFIDMHSPSDTQRAVDQKNLNEVIDFCEQKRCRLTYLNNYLGKSEGDSCGNCDNCLKGKRLWDGSRHGTTDINKHKRALEGVKSLEYSRMGGFGKISCCECSFSESNTSFLHGLIKEDGSQTSSTGYQCQKCGEFSSLGPGGDLRCHCGGDLSRKELLFCPMCKSTKLIYKMKFIT